MRWLAAGVVLAMMVGAWLWIGREPTASARFDQQLEIPAPSPSVATERAPATPLPTVALPATAPAAPDSAPVALPAVTAELTAHAMPDAQRCLAATGKAVRERTLAVHRWVDANGITHFSDTAPVGASTEHRVIAVTGVPPIVVRARGHDVNLPSMLEQRAVADAQAIERVLRNSLGVEGDPGFALEIVFVQSAEAYAGFVGNPELAGSAGAYSSRNRTIYVRWQAREQDNFTIVRHEIAHALVHERIGNLPVAINEGLAGFFERIEVYGLGAQVTLQDEQRALRAATVSDGGADELVDLLARDPASFYADGREVRYLRAFALVATLMSQASGRSALASVLAAQRADSCVPVDLGKLLEAGYPGGLAGLAADWSRWLRDPPPTVHAY